MALGGVHRALALTMLGAVVVAGCSGSDGSASPDASVEGLRAVRVGPPVEVQVGEHTFVARCAGDEAAPAVMLVSGEGTMDDEWSEVQPRIGAFARVCAYDRLGVGRSGSPPAEQTFDDMASDLREVIRALGLKRPVVLVAGSVGGFVATALARQSRKLARGLLLIDAAGPGYPQAVLDRLPAQSGRRGAEERDGWEAWMSPELNRERLDGRRAFAAAERAERFSGVSLIALTHSIPEHHEDTSPRQQADLESAWEAGQNRWLSLSTQGRLERVDLAGHAIARDQPDVVVDRVRELVGAGASGGA
jgi:pimeloyl-ACP methyl ester carboxylesterase